MRTNKPGFMLCLVAVAVLLCTGANPGHAETKSGFYRVAQDKGAWWFVAPHGERLFSLGVCCVDPGAKAKTYKAERPEYAAFQHYPTTGDWAKATLTRLHTWHFNTLGGWCDTDALTQVPGDTTPYTLVLHLGTVMPAQAPWCDLFSDEVAKAFDRYARQQIEPHKNDPRLLGYFTDNELGWWGDTLFLHFLKQPPQNATHRVLMRLLQSHYDNDFTRLQRDFNTEGVTNFADLDAKGALTLRPGGNGMAVVDAFLYRLAERYYQIANAAVRHYDTHHLILGDRYAGYCPFAVAKAARNYVDVISTNYGADWNDGGNARFFLDTLHQVTGKPVLITEFYFCARENRSGDKNTSASFPTVQTQRERAAGFRTTLTGFASLPYVVGAHWFQYYDEPTFGRGDGENYNMGLVDIADRPYDALVNAATKAPLADVHRAAGRSATEAAQVPRAPQDPFVGLAGWDKARSFVPGIVAEPFGDLYACWNANTLYLAVHAAEFVDPALYPGKVVPPGERMTWTVVPSSAHPPIQFRFGPGGPPLMDDPTIQSRTWDASTRFTALLALPASYFGKAHFAPGDKIPLQAMLASHSRWAKMRWQKTLTLSGPTLAVASYTLRQQNDHWWLITPQGNPFFSLGVCCVTPGLPWSDYKPQNPAYAAWQEYADPTLWADTTLERLKSWGFTTIGGWSDTTTLKRSPQMALAYTLVLHLGAATGLPWRDMWDPANIALMDQVARDQILPVRNDPRLLGYYTDNEMGWWNGALFKMALEQKPQSGQRQRLLQLLHTRYRSDWSRLLQDFVPVGAMNFKTLDQHGVLYLRPGGNGMATIRKFLSLAADRYYALVRQVIRKYDSRGLILGDRYQSFYYPEVAQASGPYLDAVSTNINANWTDGTFVRFYLDSLHTLARKPVQIGEFYLCATENGSGNKNDSSGFPVVPTQRERAEGFKNTLTALAQLPYVVGADWFQFADEPARGRDDGENYNMGLVDIHDQPYQDLVTASAALHPDRVHAAPPMPRPNATGGVPPASTNPLAHGKPMEALRDWDRERGFVPAQSPAPIADMYLCWDADAVYVGLYAIDILENTYYKDKQIPEADRMVWSLNLGAGQKPIRVRLGAGRPPVGVEAPVTVLDLSGIDHDVRDIAVVRLPASLFGKQTLQAGDTLSLTSTLVSFARAYRVRWNGNFTLTK